MHAKCKIRIIPQKFKARIFICSQRILSCRSATRLASALFNSGRNLGPQQPTAPIEARLKHSELIVLHSDLQEYHERHCEDRNARRQDGNNPMLQSLIA